MRGWIDSLRSSLGQLAGLSRTDRAAGTQRTNGSEPTHQLIAADARSRWPSQSAARDLLTPHPAEAARLWASPFRIHADRFHARDLARSSSVPFSKATAAYARLKTVTGM